MYWREFANIYSSGKSCMLAREHKLYNGAVLAMSVDLDKASSKFFFFFFFSFCTYIDEMLTFFDFIFFLPFFLIKGTNVEMKKKAVTHCRLVHGNMAEGHAMGTTCNAFNRQASVHPPKPIHPQSNSILLFAVRHGTSTWNVAKKFGEKAHELLKHDSPLNREGYKDAFVLRHHILAAKVDTSFVFLSNLQNN